MTSRPCKICQQLFSHRGITGHEISCDRKAKATEKAIAFNAQLRLQQQNAATHEIQRAQPDYLNPPSTPDDFPIYSGVDNREDGPDFSQFDLPDASTLAQDTEIKRVFHPKSKRATKYQSLDNWLREDAHCDAHSNGPIPELDPRPWSPFPTRLDFDVADFANENMLNKGAINGLISLIRRVAANISDFTLTNATELDEYWERASTKCTAFEKRDVTVRYKNVPHTFEMHVRPLWQWTMDFITDPRLAPYFTWDAEKSYRFNGNKYVRFIKEPWMADEYWDLQSGLPDTSDEHAKLCPYILYADKAKLSSFGTQKGYPIIARLANMTVGIRNTTRWGGGAVVGWLPIVAEDTNETGKTPYTNFKTAVWHASFTELLESITTYSKTGIWVKCGDGIERHLFPVLLILAADYEEASVMTLIRGYPSLHPCPVCLVHLDALSDPTDSSPLRTAIESERAVKEAREMSAQDREQKLKELGLRNVDNAFWLLSPRSDLHRASSFDRLHFYDSGLWGHHLFTQLKAHIDASGTRQLSVLDKQFDKLPRWPNLNHFATVSNISFNDGSKHRDVAKMVLFASHNLLKDELGQQLLQCIRAYLEVDMYLDLELQTEETIEEGQEALKRFRALLKNYAEACQKADSPFSKNWNFPKAHLHEHAFRDILRKGASRNFGTKNDESMHGKIRTAYLRLTNFKDVAPQILRFVHRSTVGKYIRDQLDVLDRAADNSDDEESMQDDIEELGNARLGGRRKAVAFTVLEEEHKDDPAYLNFRSRFSTFLSRFLQAYGHALPGAKPVKFLPQHEIIPHANLKVYFKSLDNWMDADDILRCSPSFFGHERYDAVLVKTATGDIFARLVFLFTCEVDGKRLPFALIQAMDAPTGQRTAKDKRLGFYRVREKARRQSEFISAHSIIRGALLAPDFEKPGNYLAADLVDTDMFFRLKKMYS
ncbi:hypothetical protein C8F01DRAFT_1062415 [Mycena amicta]|nr:hypothetical protein C8F01DRAFT_1062415 [Mycena amicta]